MANRSSRNPGQLARFEMSGGISTDVPAYAVNTGQAAEALAAVAGSLSAKLGQMADRAAKREGALAGLSAGQQAGASYLQQQSVVGQAAGVAGSGPWHEQAKALIRKEEGYRDLPYWDVNAHRIGYGSDTTVTADGKVLRVAKGMRISREDAERDLDYRLTQREGRQAQRQLGDLWEKLPAGAKAGLASVAYNYGSLPKAVVAAARSGDVGAIADAVAALPANSKRRGREAALIRGAGGTAVDPVMTTSTTDKANGGVPVLSTEPLALRRDGTIRGDALDDAALSAWGWRMQEGVSTELFAAQLQHQDDPEGFAAAAADIRSRYAGDVPDPQMREVFEQTFSKNVRAYGMNIASRHEARLRQEQEQSFSAGLAAKSVDIERQAQVLGANAEGDAIIGDQVAAMQRSIDAAVDQGIITPAQAQKEKETIAKTAAFGRVQGVYEALPTPEAREQFALELLEDWREGKGPMASLPFAEVKARSDVLFNQARFEINRRQAENRLEAAKLATLAKDDVASIRTSGQGLSPDSGLSVDRMRDIAGNDAVIAWQAEQDHARRIYSATNGMETQTEADIVERLDVMTPKPGTAGFVEQSEIFDIARKRASDVLKARADDPAGFVERNYPAVAGLAELANPQDPQSMQALVTARLDAQAALGIGELSRAPLTGVEARNLAQAVTLQADAGMQAKAMIDLVEQVGAVYGPHAERVLNQVLQAKGIDKKMAEGAARQLRRIAGGGSVTAGERRESRVLDETGVAERAATPSLSRTGASGNLLEVEPSASRLSSTVVPVKRPNLASIQYLQANPGLATQFDAVYGEGASRQFLKEK